MSTFIAYTLMVSLLLIPLYIIEKWLLTHHTFFRFNRVVILLTLVGAMIIPALTDNLQGMFGNTHTVGMNINITEKPQVTFIEDNPKSFESYLIVALVYIYYIGLAIALIRVLKGLYWIGHKIHSSQGIASQITQGTRWQVRLSDDTDISPFSWGRWIVINRSDYNAPEKETILLHETAHLDNGHWIDLILAELIAAILWYNPVGRLMCRELQNIHEYEADQRVLQSGTNASSYQLMLLKKAVGSRFPSIANSLDHSNISKRIKMMLKTKSSRRLRLQSAAILPAIAVGLALSSIPAVAEVINSFSDAKITNISADRQIEKSQVLQIDEEREYHEEEDAPTVNTTDPETPTKASTTYEVLPQYEGGEGELMHHITKNLRWPAGQSTVIDGKAVKGRIIIRFVVNTDCTTSDFEIVNSNLPKPFEEEAIRAVSTLKFKEPGKMKGKPVAVHYTVPVTFSAK